MALRTFPKIMSLSISMVLTSVSPSYQVGGVELADQREALNLVKQFADEICTQVPLESSHDSIQLSSKAAFSLNRFIASLLRLGVSGSSQLERDNYSGILPEQLAESIHRSDDCRLAVLREIKSIIPLPTTSNEGAVSSQGGNRIESRASIDINLGQRISGKFTEDNPKQIYKLHLTEVFDYVQPIVTEMRGQRISVKQLLGGSSDMDRYSFLGSDLNAMLSCTLDAGPFLVHGEEYIDVEVALCGPGRSAYSLGFEGGSWQR